MIAKNYLLDRFLADEGREIVIFRPSYVTRAMAIQG
jgi:hypothetical protein